MRALVTGAAGFIGSHLVDALVDQGVEVVAIDALTPFYAIEDKQRNIRLHGLVRFIKGDLGRLDLPPLLEGVGHVFHLAAQAGVRTSWGDGFVDYLDHNLLSTQRLLEACVGQKQITAFVYASSSSIYGHCYEPSREFGTPRPVSPYGVTKLAMEHLCTSYQQQFKVPTVGLRYFTVFGPRQRPDMAIRRFIEAALDDEPIQVYGDGSQTREFTYVDDVVNATLTATHARPGRIYNVGGGSSKSINQVVDYVSLAVGRPIAVQHRPTQPGDAEHTWADVSLIQQELSWTPTTTFEIGLRKQVQWCRERRCGLEAKSA